MTKKFIKYAIIYDFKFFINIKIAQCDVFFNKLYFMALIS